MQKHVMEATQQHPAVDVGSSALGPVLRVMGFAVRREDPASRPETSPVAYRESELLLRREEPLLCAYVQRIAARVDSDLDRPDVAQNPVDHRTG